MLLLSSPMAYRATKLDVPRRRSRVEGEDPEGETVQEQMGQVGLYESAGDEREVVATLCEPVRTQEIVLDQRRKREQAQRTDDQDCGQHQR